MRDAQNWKVWQNKAEAYTAFTQQLVIPDPNWNNDDNDDQAMNILL